MYYMYSRQDLSQLYTTVLVRFCGFHVRVQYCTVKSAVSMEASAARATGAAATTTLPQDGAPLMVPGEPPPTTRATSQFPAGFTSDRLAHVVVGEHFEMASLQNVAAKAAPNPPPPPQMAPMGASAECETTGGGPGGSAIGRDVEGRRGGE